MSGRILVVDEEQGTRDLLQAGLAREGFEVDIATSAKDAFELVRAHDDEAYDVVLADVSLGEGSGTTLCRQLILQRPEVPVVVMTDVGAVEPAVAAIRDGAFDLVCKPLQLDSVVLRVQRAVQHRQLRAEIERLRDRSGGSAPRASEREGTAHMMTLDELERRYIHQVIDAAGGNKALAARTLGLDRRTLYRKLERYAAEEHTAED